MPDLEAFLAEWGPAQVRHVETELLALLAARASLLALARELWSALDEQRSRDARVMSPRLRDLHTRLGPAIRQAEGDPDA